jgi:hypothetical protein
VRAFLLSCYGATDLQNILDRGALSIQIFPRAKLQENAGILDSDSDPDSDSD